MAVTWHCIVLQLNVSNVHDGLGWWVVHPAIIIVYFANDMRPDCVHCRLSIAPTIPRSHDGHMARPQLSTYLLTYFPLTGTSLPVCEISGLPGGRTRPLSLPQLCRRTAAVHVRAFMSCMWGPGHFLWSPESGAGYEPTARPTRNLQVSCRRVNNAFSAC